MSKGPGIQQRRILAVLEKYPAFYLEDLYRPDPFFVIEGKPFNPASSRSEKVSLIRAANELWRAGKIDLKRAHTKPILVVSRRGFYSWDDMIINPSVELTPFRKSILNAVAAAYESGFQELKRRGRTISDEFNPARIQHIQTSRGVTIQHLKTKSSLT